MFMDRVLASSIQVQRGTWYLWLILYVGHQKILLPLQWCSSQGQGRLQQSVLLPENLSFYGEIFTLHWKSTPYQSPFLLVQKGFLLKCQVGFKAAC